MLINVQKYVPALEHRKLEDQLVITTTNLSDSLGSHSNLLVFKGTSAVAVNVLHLLVVEVLSPTAFKQDACLSHNRWSLTARPCCSLAHDDHSCFLVQGPCTSGNACPSPKVLLLDSSSPWGCCAIASYALASALIASYQPPRWCVHVAGVEPSD
jgi:hypothetical protein